MKIGNEYISLEITCKRSTNLDPISQDTVEKCIEIAMEAHEGQRDRDGNAVILHPLLVGSMGMTDAEKCVGFLHDVVEDRDWTFDAVRKEAIPDGVIAAGELCTHDEGKDYFEYVRQIIDSGNMTAIHVKQNDLRHNIARGKAFGYTDLVEKHEKALQMIEDFLQKIKYSRGCPII